MRTPPSTQRSSKAHHYPTVFAADALQVMSVALKERPDAILLDLGLPGGNGLMVLQRLKANISLGCIPVIIVTAEDPQVAEARALEAGAVAFLQKPVDQDKLMAALQHAVEQLRRSEKKEIIGMKGS